MRQIFAMLGIYTWSISFLFFILWVIILYKLRKKDYPSWILNKINVKPKEWAKRRNLIKIIACIIAPIISLGHLKIVITKFFTNKIDFYEIFLPSFLSITLPGVILFFFSFLIVNTFYKYSKKHHKRSIDT